MDKKSDWIMHEYRLESQENAPPQEEGWVVCRAFKKRTASNGSQNKGLEGWDSSYFYDEPSVVSSVVDPVDYITRQNQQQQQQQPHNQNYLSHNFLCKQELEAENLNNNFMNSDQFVQLPQLESPSLPLIKRPSSSLSLNEEEEQLEEQQRECKNPEKVTDWRALDKFVASQLMSQEDTIRYDDQGGANGVSSFNGNLQSNSDMAALLLLQSGGGRDEDEEEKRLNNVFLNSSSEFCDIGICIFEK